MSQTQIRPRPLPLKIQRELEQLSRLTTRTQETHSRVYGKGSHLEVIRELTEKEYERVFSIAKKYQLPIGIEDSNAGFNFAVVIFAHPEHKDERLMGIFWILDANIPKSIRDTWRQKPGDRYMDDKADYFEPLVWNEQNLKMLSSYGIQLRDKYSYRY